MGQMYEVDTLVCNHWNKVSHHSFCWHIYFWIFTPYRSLKHSLVTLSHRLFGVFFLFFSVCMCACFFWVNFVDSLSTAVSRLWLIKKNKDNWVKLKSTKKENNFLLIWDYFLFGPEGNMLCSSAHFKNDSWIMINACLKPILFVWGATINGYNKF